ncbi:MAG: hypothetical protein LLG09_08680, partial [Negativicutes bacterium]|nr:hypothetical protein [Negativicutes bacterium]
LDGVELLKIGSTEMILIEMPYGVPDPWSYDELIAVAARGFHIIIAHVDRYPVKATQRLLELEVLAQVNAAAFHSIWGGQIYRKWIQTGRVHLLGSDVHEAAALQYQDFSKALTRLAKWEEQLMANANAVLAGESIDC